MFNLGITHPCLSILFLNIFTLLALTQYGLNLSQLFIIL